MIHGRSGSFVRPPVEWRPMKANCDVAEVHVVAYRPIETDVVPARLGVVRREGLASAEIPECHRDHVEKHRVEDPTVRGQEVQADRHRPSSS